MLWIIWCMESVALRSFSPDMGLKISVASLAAPAKSRMSSEAIGSGTERELGLPVGDGQLLPATAVDSRRKGQLTGRRAALTAEAAILARNIQIDAFGPQAYRIIHRLRAIQREMAEIRNELFPKHDEPPGAGSASSSGS